MKKLYLIQEKQNLPDIKLAQKYLKIRISVKNNKK